MAILFVDDTLSLHRQPFSGESVCVKNFSFPKEKHFLRWAIRWKKELESGANSAFQEGLSNFPRKDQERDTEEEK